eukprot:5471141-Pyramimonas_sp.AAC.1
MAQAVEATSLADPDECEDDFEVLSGKDTAQVWVSLATRLVRLAFKRRCWAHLGQHLCTIKRRGQDGSNSPGRPGASTGSRASAGRATASTSGRGRRE